MKKNETILANIFDIVIVRIDLNIKLMKMLQQFNRFYDAFLTRPVLILEFPVVGNSSA